MFKNFLYFTYRLMFRGINCFHRLLFKNFQIMTNKPLNILVMTENNCSKTFEHTKQNIYKCISSSSYPVYQLLDSELLTQPWIESTSLLVLCSKEIFDCEISILHEYMNHSGSILLICSKFKSLFGYNCKVVSNLDPFVKIKVSDTFEQLFVRGEYVYRSPESDILYTDDNKMPLLQKSLIGNGVFIISEVYIDRELNFFQKDLSDVVSNRANDFLFLKKILKENFMLKFNDELSLKYLSPGYYFYNSDKVQPFLNNCSSYQCSITFKEEKTVIDIYLYDKCINLTNELICFDFSLYFSILNSDEFGQHIIYFSTISSTMDIIDHVSKCEGMVIFASTQLSGKGRGFNKWISPSGCVAFTLSFSLPLVSNLGQKLSMIQHIAALAVVHGIRSNTKYNDLNVKIKWPNDIYFDNLKIGGLLVTSIMEDNIIKLRVGWGINVSNSHPTTCLNDIIKNYYNKGDSKMPYIKIEEVVAFTITQMENFIKDFQNAGPSRTFSYYYSYWMHENQEVTIKELNEKGTITGIDEYGFLTVKTSKGKEISLQPDGNRFDLTKNLIFAK